MAKRCIVKAWNEERENTKNRQYLEKRIRRRKKNKNKITRKCRKRNRQTCIINILPFGYVQKSFEKNRMKRN